MIDSIQTFLRTITNTSLPFKKPQKIQDIALANMTHISDVSSPLETVYKRAFALTSGLRCWLDSSQQPTGFLRIIFCKGDRMEKGFQTRQR